MTTTTLTPLHRLRPPHFPSPSPLTALQFTPLPLPPAHPAHAAAQAEKQWAGGGVEWGNLVVARENGEVEVWGYVESARSGGVGGWVLERVHPSTLTHPTISLLTLASRDPSSFHAPGARRVPRIEELRLFTAGKEGGDLVERCLVSGRILQIHSLPSSPIWSLSLSPTHQTLALTTSSPHIHFLSLSPSPFSPELTPSSPLHRSEPLPAKTRTLSIAWGPPTRVELPQKGGESEWIWRESYLVTGNSDSSVRKWHAGSGRIVGRGVVQKPRKEKKQALARGNVVWCVGVLSDHTIISSDSLGSVTFWDGASLAPSQTFQAHAADAMCLVIGPGGKSVFTSGPDQKVAQFTLVSGASHSSRSQWVQTTLKRLHQHDVRSLTIFPPYTPFPSVPPLNPSYAPVLASGGWDMQVLLTPCSSPDLLSGGERRNPIYPAPQTSFSDAQQRGLGMSNMGGGWGRVGWSKGARLGWARRERGVGVWRVNEREGVDGGEESAWEKVLEMDLSLRTSLTACCISDDGKWMAVADLYETKLFRLKTDPDTSSLTPRKLHSLPATLLTHLPHLPLSSLGPGSLSLAFTPDSSRLVLGFALMPVMVVLELPRVKGGECRVVGSWVIGGSEGGRVVKSLPTRGGVQNGNGMNGHGVPDEMGSEEDDSSSAGGGDGMDVDSDEEDETEGAGMEYKGRVVMIECSADGQWLVGADTERRVGVWSLDLMKLHCNLPTLPQPAIAMTFTSPSTLLLAHPVDHLLTHFNIDTKSLLPSLLSSYKAVKGQTGQVRGMVMHPAGGKVVTWGNGWVASVVVPLGGRSKAVKRKEKRSALRMVEDVDGEVGSEEEEEAAGEANGVKVITKYRSIASVGVVGSELVVVERPFSDLRGLPQAFSGAKYGS